MLRTVQHELRTQIDVNAARKERLYAIATDRMAYQDYMSCMTSVEKEIEMCVACRASPF
jgi:transcriptional adapter 3